MRIRRYLPADRDEVLALHRAGLADVGVRPGDGVYYEDDLSRIPEIYLHDGGEFLIGHIDGRVMAMGALRRVGDGVAEMCRLRIHPDFHRRGHGSAMLRALVDHARSLGYTALVANTTLGQRAALALYRKYGWRELGRARVGEHTVVYLGRRLDPAD
ncbi:GNAT family N-acetyltransferase [Rhizohabitans arisaemae]|uniref:GNAT family N-acetyltransferase n=1 Tax=Rhizohabitans arisaemae TaxID=2720610 RepID=UPI0024B09A08|nr:GNAT family N-acetyltransferase [Rhizohabitans arisaemae]